MGRNEQIMRLTKKRATMKIDVETLTMTFINVCVVSGRTQHTHKISFEDEEQHCFSSYFMAVLNEQRMHAY